MMRYFELTFPSSHYRKPGFYDNRSDFLCVSTEDKTLRTLHLSASEMSTTIINSREYAVINRSGLHRWERGRSERTLLSKRPS